MNNHHNNSKIDLSSLKNYESILKLLEQEDIDDNIILYIRITTIILSAISVILLLKILVEIYKKYLLKRYASISNSINENTGIYNKYIY